MRPTGSRSDTTERHEAILKFLRREHDESGVFPSVREIAAHLGVKSTNTVHYYLRQLEEKGLLKRRGRLARSFTLPAAGAPSDGRSGVPLLGRVAAGTPILAEQNFEGMVNIGALFDASRDTFALRVRGDSMIGAGIHDGDLVIVRKQVSVEQGQIAVAVLGDEATVKRLYDEGAAWRLQPENPALEPIRVRKDSPDFRIAGKVVGVIRKL